MHMWKSSKPLNRLVGALAALLVCSHAHSADRLSEADLVGLGAIGAAYVIDYRQTLDIKNHAGMYETNPLLGKHPSDVKVRNYFIASGLTTLGVVYLLPKEYRKYLIGGVLAVEVAVIGHNKHIGLRVNF